MTTARPPRPRGLLWLVGPGVLVAATGVGAGDFASAGLAGSQLGIAVLWAVLAGAVVKFVLTENLARWQIATGETVVEGAIARLGWLVVVPFAAYLLAWSYFTGVALVKACGVTIAAIVPVDATVAGAACSLIGGALAWFGGFRLFERVMAVCIGVMFAVVVVAAIVRAPTLGELAGGLVPRVPRGGLRSTIALIGGVGGTLTILCYAYWMREAGRDGPEDMRRCRVDIAIGYGVTAIFGAAMLVLASGMTLDARGLALVGELTRRVGEDLGPVGRAVFLAGSLGAFFSSLLGVWQAVPYIFADVWRHRLSVGRRAAGAEPVSPKAAPYRTALAHIATVPLLGLDTSFRQAQMAYLLLGAWFIPMLALTLLLLNGRRRWIGERWRNRTASTVALLAALLVVLAMSVVQVLDAIDRARSAERQSEVRSAATSAAAASASGMLAA